MSWRVVYTKAARKDASKLAAAGLRPKALALLELLGQNPHRSPPPSEKLVGDLSGAYSRRINIQHRLVDQVLERERVVKVLRNVDPLRIGAASNGERAALPLPLPMHSTSPGCPARWSWGDASDSPYRVRPP